MRWPQITIISYAFLTRIAAVVFHKRQIDVDGVSAVIIAAFVQWTLWMGGFYS